ncbi:MAG: hypothetical protein VYD86_09335, partial [Verrucomicrobiota bacterium]|nr:hypothetical protein [Verrucomicrobiota bacterium]
TPLRDATKATVTGGNRRLWDLHALQPRLGWFDGREGEIPFDYHDVLGQVLPKPCLIVTPKRDRFADHSAITEAIKQLRLAKPKQAEAALTWQSPDDTNRFQADQNQQFINWTKSLR